MEKKHIAIIVAITVLVIVVIVLFIVSGKKLEQSEGSFMSEEIDPRIGKETAIVKTTFLAPVITRTVNGTATTSSGQTQVLTGTVSPLLVGTANVNVNGAQAPLTEGQITIAKTNVPTANTSLEIVIAESNPTSGVIKVAADSSNFIKEGAVSQIITKTIPTELQTTTSSSLSNSKFVSFVNVSKSPYEQLYYYGNSSESQCLFINAPKLTGGYFLKFTCLNTEVLNTPIITFFVYTRGGFSNTFTQQQIDMVPTMVFKASLVPPEGITQQNCKPEFYGKTHIIMMAVDENNKLATTYNMSASGYFKVALAGFSSAVYEEITSALISRDPVIMQTTSSSVITPRTGVMTVPSLTSVFPRGKACVMHMVKTTDTLPGHVNFTTELKGRQSVRSFYYFPEPPDFMYTTACDIASVTYGQLTYDVIRQSTDVRTPAQSKLFTIYLPDIRKLSYT